MDVMLFIAKAAILAADDGKVFGHLSLKEIEFYMDKVAGSLTEAEKMGYVDSVIETYSEKE